MGRRGWQPPTSWCVAAALNQPEHGPPPISPRLPSLTAADTGAHHLGAGGRVPSKAHAAGWKSR